MNPTDDNPFLAILFDHAGRKATHPALRHKGQVMTYDELAAAVQKTAGGLSRSGIGKGDRVLLFVPMSIQLYVLLLAIWHRGATAVFLDAWADRKRLEHAIKLADCRGFIGVFKTHLFRLISPALRSIPVKRFAGWMPSGEPPSVTPVEPEQTALLTFTTGSTGTPKAADRTVGFLLAQHHALSHHLSPRKDEVDLTALPIFVLTNIASGITSVIPDMDHRHPERVDPAVLLKELDHHRVTRACGSPVIFDRLARHCEQTGRRPETLRRIFLGGAPVFPDLAERLVRAFPHVEVEIVFGSTEAEPISRVNAATVAQSRITSPDQGLPVGKPVEEIDCRILEIQYGPIEVTSVEALDRITLPAGSVGEICVGGDHVLKAYFNNPEAVRENKIIAGESLWHRTGDAGYLDRNGELYLMGRVGSRFDREGRRYFVFPLESMLGDLPGVTLGTYLTHGDQLILVYEGTAEETALLQQIRSGPLPEPDRILQMPIPRDPRHNSKIDYGILRLRIETNG
ncbi:MAG: AMP-binding protein [Desulfococcaceae bacterium]